MALKKDLAALATKEALAKKVVGKRKRPTVAGDEWELYRQRKGPAVAKVVPPVITENVIEDIPDITTMMPPSFLVMRSSREGFRCLAYPAREGIRGSLLNEDVHIF